MGSVMPAAAIGSAAASGGTNATSSNGRGLLRDGILRFEPLNWSRREEALTSRCFRWSGLTSAATGFTGRAGLAFMLDSVGENRGPRSGCAGGGALFRLFHLLAR